MTLQPLYTGKSRKVKLGTHWTERATGMINLTVGMNNCLCALMYQIVSVLCAIKKIIYLHWFSVMDIVL